MALYYLTLGEDYFSGRWEDGLRDKVKGIIQDIERSSYITQQDKQEVWEVLTYLNIGGHSTIDFYEYQKLGLFLGKHSLVREWDIELILFNSDLLFCKWQQLYEPLTSQSWDKFKEYYREYKRILKRPQTLYLTLREVLYVMESYETRRQRKGLNIRSNEVLDGMLRGDKKEYGVYNYKKTVELLSSRGYKVKDLDGNYIEGYIMYTLDDIIELIELYYPQLVESKTYTVKGELDYFTFRGLLHGIRYGDKIDKVDVKGDLLGDKERELYFK